jgi:ATP-dependent Clp protease ATP-binding subunit ClpA
MLDEHDFERFLDRFTDAAKRALVHTRIVLSEHGGTEMAPEHLLLGILLADANTLRRFVPSNDAIETIRAELVAAMAGGALLPPAHGVPFSESAGRILERATSEADGLKQAEVRPEHLLLGVLEEASSKAAEVLRNAGVQTAAIRELLQSGRS